jgi:hypothetical protein
MKKIIFSLLEKVTGEKLFKALKEFFSTKSIIKGMIIAGVILCYLNWGAIKNTYHSILKIGGIHEDITKVKEAQQEINNKQDSLMMKVQNRFSRQDSTIVLMNRKLNKIEFKTRINEKNQKLHRRKIYEYLEIVASKAEVSAEIIRLLKAQTDEIVNNERFENQ